MARHRSVFGAWAALVLLGCSSEEEPGSPDLGEVTFYEDVAPILYDNCVGCHRPESIAPFSLIDYESARPIAPNIAAAVQGRHMPPMPVDNSGACNTYSNARWLSDHEIAVLGAWADQGAPEGNPDNAPTVPEVAAGLEAPDVTLDPGFSYTPSDALPDDYRCFVLPAPVTSTRFITAYEVVPGDPRVVHHMIVYQPSSAAESVAAHALDAAEPGDGYTCFGGPRVGADPVVLWAPGSGVITLPEGTGVMLEPGRELVMQVHYNLEHGVHPDQTRVGLRLADSVDRPARYEPIANGDLALAPGKPYVESEATVGFAFDGVVTIHGALPHMHTLGRTMQVDYQAGFRTGCLVSVPRWDFHWQNAWWYDDPLEIAGLDSATISCGYDTSERTETVYWGDGTADEMCISYFYVTPE